MGLGSRRRLERAVTDEAVSAARSLKGTATRKVYLFNTQQALTKKLGEVAQGITSKAEGLITFLGSERPIESLGLVRFAVTVRFPNCVGLKSGRQPERREGSRPGAHHFPKGVVKLFLVLSRAGSIRMAWYARYRRI